MQAIAENPALPQLVGARDAVTQDTRTEAQPDPAGVPGEVRAPAVARSDEVPDDGRGGDAGVSGVAQGEAGEGLGGETDTQDGDGDRPSVPEVGSHPPPPLKSFHPMSWAPAHRRSNANEFTVADLRRVLSLKPSLQLKKSSRSPIFSSCFREFNVRTLRLMTCFSCFEVTA